MLVNWPCLLGRKLQPCTRLFPLKRCRGVYYQNIWIFSKMIFFPSSTMKISSFPPFFHPLPLIFNFFLNKSSYFFPHQPITHNFEVKNIHPWKDVNEQKSSVFSKKYYKHLLRGTCSANGYIFFYFVLYVELAILFKLYFAFVLNI